MSKNPFEEMDPEVQAMRSSMKPTSGPMRWGRVLTGVLIVVCVTFAFAYYMPLQRAHETLTQRFIELQSQVDTVNRALGEAQGKVKDLSANKQALEQQIEEGKQREKARTDASRAVKTALESKLQKPLAKAQAALGFADGQAMAALSLGYLLSPGKLDVSAQGKAALCSVVGASSKRTIRVLAIADKKSIPATLAAKLKTPLQYSVAVAQLVSETLLDKCNADAGRVSAAGVASEPTASKKLEGKKLAGSRVELWLDSGQ